VAVSYQLVVARLVFMGSLDFSEMVIIAVDQRAHFFVKITAICVCMCTREIKKNKCCQKQNRSSAPGPKISTDRQPMPVSAVDLIDIE